MSGNGAREVELVPARDLVAGDVVVLPLGVRRTVVELHPFDELTGRDPGPRLRVLVSGGRSEAYDGVRSGRPGIASIDVAVLGLRPLRPDELVTVERG